jgi:acetylornithine deacetylase
MVLTPIETLTDLIRIPSVNPMDRGETAGIYGEGRLTDHLEKLCRQLGVTTFRQPVHPGRDNLIAVLPGEPDPDKNPAGGGRLLLWEVHQDTVAVEGMTIDPFAASIRDRRVYGRGACDVKGGMAAMLTAFSRLAELPPSNRATIVLAFTVNEEFGFSGARALTGLWTDSDVRDRDLAECVWPSTLDPRPSTLRPPDAVIVAEPTELKVVAAHKGVARWQCHTVGRAAHTSQPELGANAVYAMAGVVSAIERYAAQVVPQLPAHPLCGGPTVCVSTIRGGVGVNTIPERATIDIDRRLTPDEDPRRAIDGLVRFIAENTDPGACRVVHDPPLMISRGLSSTANQAWADELVDVARQVQPSSQIVGARYGTDAAVISESGVPTVVFGPGSIAQAHTADEWIEIEQLELAAEIYYQVGS